MSSRPSQGAWSTQVAAVARRYDREYRGQAVQVPPEIEEMPIFREWAAGRLAGQLASPFWQLAQPRRRQRCLDIGCGISFLVYPWVEWDAWFHGHDVSAVAVEALRSRAPQLNSKLFKGVCQGAAHQLEYDQQFDLVISTGVSCYYPIEYWQQVLAQVRRVLKPGAVFVFDVVNPEVPLAENWAILETYLGAEVMLTPLEDWSPMLKQAGVKILKQQDHGLFHLFKVTWPG
ncbi:Ubiquinone/menaquinone biosynthesis C-methyltransferase UbiE [Halomicronema hongdechloris C2206]|uniref:Ubiquinone/menaquinone biosynthesis C-methyltransferase UbiE n=1 Tax=Halomicronema hongdechloris C2206 TaxID=1641165 RepID=A0A1Z3HS34_9CYAN|nr:class I SAM-dependent methyltransferase [Halomicronema hongdechloris]ASC73124.1 Ubiquinone/menaquinone biosynthesis C-methyltransferase UbiE [Halomicronema hongdechloris C2206]